MEAQVVSSELYPDCTVILLHLKCEADQVVLVALMHLSWINLGGSATLGLHL